ncbi:MAG: CapA family protein [Ignavibacteria bacterium]|nr:CapA family protein [Ignavibacteria bacterium]
MKKQYIQLILFLAAFTVYADTTRVMFLGDTHFGDNYFFRSNYSVKTNYITDYGYDYFFENVKDLLFASDLNIVNFETTLNNPIGLPYLITKPYSHFCDTLVTPAIMLKYNIRAASLGNNHSMDYSFHYMLSTITRLKESGISSFGAGISSKEALEPLVFNSANISLAVFGGFEFRQSYDSLYHFYADSFYAGVNCIDKDVMQDKISEYKKLYPKTIIVVYPHWGGNYKQVREGQISTAHKLIDGGADLIIGHGAHTVQSIELYKGKIIIYNIGNFIFNAPGRYRSTGAKPYGLMARLEATGDSKQIRLFPIFTNNKKSDYQVRFLEDEEFEDCISILKRNANAPMIIRDRSTSSYIIKTE